MNVCTQKICESLRLAGWVLIVFALTRVLTLTGMLSSWRDAHDKYYEREVQILVNGKAASHDTIRDAINFGKASDWILMHDVIRSYGDEGNYFISAPAFLAGMALLVFACILGRRKVPGQAKRSATGSDLVATVNCRSSRSL